MKYNIEKLPSGSYRVRKTINGKRETFTFQKKPTIKEIEAEIQKRSTSPVGSSKTFSHYAEEFLRINENVLKPSTLRAYKSILNALPDDFKKQKLSNIQNADIQSLINTKANEISPKTLKNYRGFISTVMAMYRPDFHVNVKVPAAPVMDKYIPSPEEVLQILEAVKGTQFYITYRVMMYGLRRGEVAALQIPEDLTDDNRLIINKAYSLGPDNKWHLMDTPKTTYSNREVRIDQELADLIREQGYVYKGSIDHMYCRLQRLQKKLGQPHWRLHEFRAYMATELTAAGVDEATILALGGWGTPNVMKRVYRKSRYGQNEGIQDHVIDVLSANKIGHELVIENEFS